MNKGNNITFTVHDVQGSHNVTKPIEPLKQSAQKLFDARYQALLDNNDTRQLALDNTARAAAMSELLGAQDRMLAKALARKKGRRNGRIVNFKQDIEPQ